ncbi:MAG: hypothetical protein KC431_01545 [Myxococcales bacterium]|nr:hypothetical protein [Myxococcales bacterium]
MSSCRVEPQLLLYTGGYALSWDGEAKRGDDGSWKVAFDFAGVGKVSLICQELKLLEAPEGSG